MRSTELTTAELIQMQTFAMFPPMSAPSANAKSRSLRRKIGAAGAVIVLFGVIATSSASAVSTYQPVVIANGWSPSDVGTAAPLAASLGGSVLYANTTSLGDPTVDALKKLKPSEVILVGGTAALTSAIETELGQVVPNVPITRLAGEDRIDTAALAALHALGKNTPEIVNSGASKIATTEGATIQRSGEITYREKRFRVGTDLRPGDWTRRSGSCDYGLGDASKEDSSLGGYNIDINDIQVYAGDVFGLVEGDIVILQAVAGRLCEIEHLND